MSLVGSLRVLFSGDSRGLNEAAQDAMRQLGSVSRQVNALNASMKGAFDVQPQTGGGGLAGMASTALKAGAALFALKQSTDFLTGAATEADKFAASGRTLVTIFADAAPAVTSTIESLANSLGLARVETSQLAVQLGANLTNAGLSAGDAAQKTADLLQRAADTAAATGYQTADAVTAIAAALRGEYDPIEKFGVSVKEAQVNSLLLSQGAQKVNGEFDRQTKLLATLQLLFQQTDKYQGAAAQTTNTATAALGRAGEAWSQLSRSLGTLVAPAITLVANLLNSVVSALNATVGGIGELVGGSKSAASAVAPMAKAIEQTNAALTKTPALMADVAKDAQSFGKSLQERQAQALFGADSDTMKLLALGQGGVGDAAMKKLADELDRVRGLEAPGSTVQRPGLATFGSREFFKAELAARTGMVTDIAKKTAENTRGTYDTLKQMLAYLKSQQPIGVGL